MNLAYIEEPMPTVLTVRLGNVEQLNIRRVALDILAEKLCIILHLKYTIHIIL